MLGLDATSQTVANLKRERECVLNLASEANVDTVNRLARTTGSRKVPLHKRLLGYRYVANKAEHGQVSLEPALDVKAMRVMDCPVQLEARVMAMRRFGHDDKTIAVPTCSVEVQISRCHVESDLVQGEHRIDPLLWRPLLMSFRRLFGLGAEQGPSPLCAGDESSYAPHKQGPLTRTVARAYGAVAHRRFAIDETTEPPPEVV